MNISVVKTHLGISGSSDDTLLTQLVGEVDAMVKRYIGRNIERADYIKRFDGKSFLVLDEKPIFIDGTHTFKIEQNVGTLGTPTWATINSDYYLVHEESGVVEFPFGKYEGNGNLRVTYTAGYETLPKDIELVIVRATSRIFNRRKSEGISNEGLEGVSVGWEKEVFLADELTTLDSYKIRRFV